MSKKQDGADFSALGEGFMKQARDISAAFAPIQQHFSERIIPGLPLMRESPEPLPMPEVYFDDSPIRTAEAVTTMAEHTAALVNLTQAAVQLAHSSQQDSKKVERFTRRMSWASLVIALASLTVALAAAIESFATG